MNKWFDYCAEKAIMLPTEEYRQRHYAVVLSKKGELLGEGANSFTKSHPVQANFSSKAGKEDSVFLHAEMSALIRCSTSRKVKDIHTLVVVRVDKKGDMCNSCPCRVCQMAMKEFGVKNVLFSV